MASEDSLCVRYSLGVADAVGDFWRSKTMTAPVDAVETIFWHRRLTTKTRLPRARIGARYFPTFHRTLRLRLQRRVRGSSPSAFRAAAPAAWRKSPPCTESPRNREPIEAASIAYPFPIALRTRSRSRGRHPPNLGGCSLVFFDETLPLCAKGNSPN